jgi:hypothetical protein
MTDRLNSFTVILEEDTRDDGAEPLMNAIRQLRGVLSVEGNVVDVDSHVAEDRARAQLLVKLFAVLEKPGKRE